MLSLGTDVNCRQEDGHTALSAAYELVSVDPTTLEMLINIGKVDLNSPMLGKDLLLYYLIGSSRLDFIATALKKGANSSALSGSEPLVVEAAIIERHDQAQLLLGAGASPDSMDRAGTSLMSWVNEGSSPCEPVACAAGRASRHVAGGSARLCAVRVMAQDPSRRAEIESDSRSRNGAARRRLVRLFTQAG